MTEAGENEDCYHIKGYRQRAHKRPIPHDSESDAATRTIDHGDLQRNFVENMPDATAEQVIT